jgi:hypothetical protein
MLDFSWTPEQIDWKARVIRTAQSELGLTLRQRDQQQTFDWVGWQTVGRLGLPGLTIPAQYGGAASDPLTALLLLIGVWLPRQWLKLYPQRPSVGVCHACPSGCCGGTA